MLTADSGDDVGTVRPARTGTPRIVARVVPGALLFTDGAIAYRRPR